MPPARASRTARLPRGRTSRAQGYPPGGVDLIIESVRIDPEEPADGAPVLFFATVKNVGTATMPAGLIVESKQLDVTFSVDGVTEIWADTYEGSLAPGASIELQANSGGPGGGGTDDFWIKTPGAHELEAKVNLGVDPPRKTEINYSNNALTMTIGAFGGEEGPPEPSPGDEADGEPASQIIYHGGLVDFFDAFGDISGLVTARHIGGIGFPSRHPNISWTPEFAEITDSNQQALVDNDVFGVLLAAGCKSYIGFRGKTDGIDHVMVADLFDDEAWTERHDPDGQLMTNHRALAAMGASGEMGDDEPYETGGDHDIAWHTNYSGNTEDTPTTMAKAYERGLAEGAALAVAWAGHPREYVMYVNSDAYMPGGWDEEVQFQINSTPRTWTDDLWWIPFKLGVFQAAGYTRIILAHAIFYRGVHIAGATFAGAIRANAIGIASWISRNYPVAWAAIYDRISFTGDHWFDQPDTAEFGGVPMDPGAAEVAAAASNRQSRFGWVLYGHQGIDYDYAPYADALEAGSDESVADTTLPTVSIDTPTRDGADILASGYGQHDDGVQALAWHRYSGGSSTPGTGTVEASGTIGFDVATLSGTRGQDNWRPRCTFEDWRIEDAPGGDWLDVVAWTIHGQHHVERIEIPA